MAQNHSLLPRVSSQAEFVTPQPLYMPFAELPMTLPMRPMPLRNLSIPCESGLMRFMQETPVMFLQIEHSPKWLEHLIFRKNFLLP